MAYNVILKPFAEKQFFKLPKDIQKRLFAAFLILDDNPRPPGSLTLQGNADCYRVRVANYRMVCLSLILSLGHRSDIYDDF